MRRESGQCRRPTDIASRVTPTAAFHLRAVPDSRYVMHLESEVPMNRIMTLALAVMLALGISMAASTAAEGKSAQTKTGTVTRVDVAAKQVVVQVARALTFTVTDDTKITRRDEPKKIEDIKPEAKVSVTYVKEGETRTAQKIAILGDQ